MPQVYYIDHTSEKWAVNRERVFSYLVERGYDPKAMSSSGLSRKGYTEFLFDDEGQRIPVPNSDTFASVQFPWASIGDWWFMKRMCPLVRE